MDFRNKVVREFWEQESQDVKNTVTEYRERRYLQGASSDEDGESESESDSGEEDKDNASASIVGGGKGKQKTPLDPAEAKAREYHA